MKTTEDILCEKLQQTGIRVTAVRLLVVKTLSAMSGVFSLADMEELLPTIDRSTLFRTLTLFAENKLLHLIDDGSGIQKYCVCHCTDQHHHHGHIHFTCVVCHKTMCLEQVEIPAVPIPAGFKVEESEYIIKGVCPQCGRKRQR